MRFTQYLTEKNKKSFTSTSSSRTIALNDTWTDLTSFKCSRCLSRPHLWFKASEIWIMNALMLKRESFCWWIGVFYLVKQVAGQHLGEPDITHVTLGVIFSAAHAERLFKINGQTPARGVSTQYSSSEELNLLLSFVSRVCMRNIERLKKFVICLNNAWRCKSEAGWKITWTVIEKCTNKPNILYFYDVLMYSC